MVVVGLLTWDICLLQTGEQLTSHELLHSGAVPAWGGKVLGCVVCSSC